MLKRERERERERTRHQGKLYQLHGLGTDVGRLYVSKHQIRISVSCIQGYGDTAKYSYFFISFFYYPS